MDLLYEDWLDAIRLVGSDSDFTRLAQRLRQGGPVVYGVDERKVPEAAAFVNLDPGHGNRSLGYRSSLIAL